MPEFERFGVSRASAVGRIALALLLGVVGSLLITDRDGLRGEYRLLSEPWEGRPIAVRVGAPVPEPSPAPGGREARWRGVLLTRALFSIRWTGWWHVARGGDYRFDLSADDGAFVRLDGTVIADTEGRFGAAAGSGTARLEPGFHRLEIGYHQVGGASRLDLQVAPPYEAPAALRVADLYAGRPLGVRAALRSALRGWSRPFRQLLGVAFWLAAIGAAGTAVARSASWRRKAATIRSRMERVAASPRGRLALLLILVGATFALVLPHTGALRGGDDAVYLSAATHGDASWFYHRYAHVYLLRMFVLLAGGDPFLGTRLWWALAFALTVGALAVAARSVGPRLQLGTLTVALLALLAQTTLIGLIGAAFADVSAMMFLALAVAVWMHDRGKARRAGGAESPRRIDFPAIAVGALSLACYRSKEVGAIAFALLPLWAIENGRVDLRRWLRRAIWWAAGAGAALLALVLLDGWLLGNFGFMWDETRKAGVHKMNFPSQMAPRPAVDTWLRVVWDPGEGGARLSLRAAWLCAAAAAITGALRRRPWEERLLRCVPLAYLAALIVLYIRLPHPFSARMLVTILPLLCLATGLLARDAGLDEIPWRQLLAPRLAVPAALAGAALLFLVVPYRIGAVTATEFIPAQLVGRFGWAPDQFVAGVLVPVLVLAGVAAVALVAARTEARLWTVLLVLLGLFGPGLAANRDALAADWAVQTGRLLLYPWRAFADELEAARPRRIAFSADLHATYKMSQSARNSIARIALLRKGTGVTLARDPGREARQADLAIVSPESFAAWRQVQPAIARGARRDALGFLVLVRPKTALRDAAATVDSPPPPAAGQDDGPAEESPPLDRRRRRRATRP